MIPTTVAVLQIVIPVILLARLFEARRRSLLAWAIFTAGVAIYMVAIAIAGVWLVLPWYTGLAYLFVIALAVLWRAGDVRTLRWRPSGRFTHVELVVAALLFTGASGLLVESVSARRAPPGTAINLSLPLRGGTYYVANGGGSELTNAHLETLQDAQFRDYRAQSYAVDIVRVDNRGLRASGVLPADLNRYASLGEAVLAPCDGAVVSAENGVFDMPPPLTDREHIAGNFVFLNCGTAHVLLGHLQRGSVSVRPGDRVTPGQRLGAIGNSGNSDEPHLHVHAQEATTGTRSLLDARPVPVTFYGRALARNDVVRTGAVPQPAMTETELLYGQLGSAIVALFMLIVSLRSRGIGRKLFAGLFGWAAAMNAWTALTSPADYLGYAGLTVSDLYRGFILGFFGQHITSIVVGIAVGQACIAIALLRGRQWQRAGLAAAVMFLLAIVPLGIGAGVPAPVILALGAGMLWREPAAPRMVIELVTTHRETHRRAA
jgi:murein DD-endopeptidase MepM/ murein hydrolase activator NlpD